MLISNILTTKITIIILKQQRINQISQILSPQFVMDKSLPVLVLSFAEEAKIKTFISPNDYFEKKFTPLTFFYLFDKIKCQLLTPNSSTSPSKGDTEAPSSFNVHR